MARDANFSTHKKTYCGVDAVILGNLHQFQRCLKNQVVKLLTLFHVQHFGSIISELKSLLNSNML